MSNLKTCFSRCCCNTVIHKLLMCALRPQNLRGLHLQSSLKSEMRNLTFAHINSFRHRHFPEAQHDFLKLHPDDFLAQTASDMASEAFDQAAAREYISRHQKPVQYIPNSNVPAEARPERLTTQERRQQRRQRQRAMPRHFFINTVYRSSLNQGDM